LTNFLSIATLIFYMTATAHALIGAAIVTKIENPLLALPVALLSHLPLDLVPHWDTITNGRQKPKIVILAQAGLDVLLGFALTWYLFSKVTPPLRLLGGIFFAQLPDWLEAPYFFFNIKAFPFYQVRVVQVKFHNKLSLPWGLLTQVAVILAIFLVFGIIPLQHRP
jgi:hypothetical protein